MKVQTKVVENGVFEINTLGEVYRINNGKKRLATITYVLAKKYGTVSATTNNKKRFFRVSRLVAEAFVPNPNGHSFIKHIDGNIQNNNANNLAWAKCTRAATECKNCGGVTYTKDKICLSCKRVLLKQSTKEKRTMMLKDKFAKIDKSLLTEREIEFINMYTQGMTMQQIGDMNGCSRQRVDQVIKKALLRGR